MNNVVIDPYFLEMENENEINNNFASFRTLIFLCDVGRINVYLYKGLIEKMRNREIVPFPIHVGTIRNPHLRQLILDLNHAFVHIMARYVRPLDIEECEGDQKFEVSSAQKEVKEQLMSDDRYYELLTILLQSCYNMQLDLSHSIVTGLIKKGRKVGEEFSLKCRCSNCFNSNYRFVCVEEFETDQDRAYLKLNDLAKSNSILFVKTPDVVRSAHHNKLQNNSDFTSFEGLSRRNKAVLSLLRRFGLRKIIFGEYHEDASQPIGTIVTYSVEKTKEWDIVKGWLFAETGFRNHVDLYFSQGVGESLMIYLKNELSKTNVERMVERL